MLTSLTFHCSRSLHSCLNSAKSSFPVRSESFVANTRFADVRSNSPCAKSEFERCKTPNSKARTRVWFKTFRESLVEDRHQLLRVDLLVLAAMSSEHLLCFLCTMRVRGALHEMHWSCANDARCLVCFTETQRMRSEHNRFQSIKLREVQLT